MFHGYIFVAKKEYNQYFFNIAYILLILYSHCCAINKINILEVYLKYSYLKYLFFEI